eukprot:6177665-Pleurochrysis_carterae.AAC.2
MSDDSRQAMEAAREKPQAGLDRAEEDAEEDDRHDDVASQELQDHARTVEATQSGPQDVAADNRMVLRPVAEIIAVESARTSGFLELQSDMVPADLEAAGVGRILRNHLLALATSPAAPDERSGLRVRLPGWTPNGYLTANLSAMSSSPTSREGSPHSSDATPTPPSFSQGQESGRAGAIYLQYRRLRHSMSSVTRPPPSGDHSALTACGQADVPHGGQCRQPLASDSEASYRSQQLSAPTSLVIEKSSSAEADLCTSILQIVASVRRQAPDFYGASASYPSGALSGEDGSRMHDSTNAERGAGQPEDLLSDSTFDADTPFFELGIDSAMLPLLGQVWLKVFVGDSTADLSLTATSDMKCMQSSYK